jgi:hypothetical protein
MKTETATLRLAFDGERVELIEPSALSREVIAALRQFAQDAARITSLDDIAPGESVVLLDDHLLLIDTMPYHLRRGTEMDDPYR